MDPRTLDFLAFCAFGVVCIVLGHQARIRGWVREEVSRLLHLITIVVFWAIAAVVSIWQLPVRAETLWLLALEPLLLIVPAGLTLLIARRVLKLSRPTAGVLAIGAGISNSGVTLGAYLCYTLLPNPAMIQDQGMGPAEIAAASDQALAYGVAVVMIMTGCVIAFLYPLARYCGPTRTDDLPLSTVIRQSLIDYRAMPLYGSLLGATLAVTGVPQPEFTTSPYFLKPLFYVSSAGAYFGIGLRLYLGQLTASIKPHALMAGVKFGGIPLLTATLLSLAMLAPTPPDTLAMVVFLVLSCMPCGIQTVVIANIFHLDARFATSVWLISTIGFLIVPLPVLVFALS